MIRPLLDYFESVAQFRIGCQESGGISRNADALCSKPKD
jgi:hypothetical protein